VRPRVGGTRCEGEAMTHQSPAEIFADTPARPPFDPELAPITDALASLIPPLS
jgi:hypothetical protein